MLRTGWSVVAGYLWAGLILFPAALVPSLLGLIDSNAIGNGAPSGYITAPYYPGGVWAAATGLAAGAVVVAVTALAIKRSLFRRTGYEVRARTAFIVLTITGWAPFLGFHAIAWSGGASLVITTLVLRWESQPATGAGPAPIPWRGLMIAGACAAALLISYGLGHPLRENGWGSAVLPGNLTESRFTVDVRNRGVADLELVSLSVPAWAGRPGYLRQLEHEVIPTGHTLTITLKRAGCSPKVVHVRYRMLGRTWSQPLVLGQDCPGRG